MDYIDIERSEEKSLHLSSLLIGAIFVFFLSLFFFDEPFYGEGPKTFALISLTFICSVVILFLRTRNRKHILFLPVIALTWIYFQRSFLLPDEIYHIFRTIPIEYINDIAFYPSLGIISLYIGYYSFINKSIKPISSTSLKAKNEDLLLIIRVMFLLTLINLIFKYLLNIYLENFIGQLAQLLDYLPTLLFALVVLLYLRENRIRGLYYPVMILLLLEYLYRVAETLFNDIIVLFIGGFLMYVFEKKKIPFLALSIFVIINMPIYITRIEYRYENVVQRWYEGKGSTYFGLVEEGFLRFFDQDFSTLFSELFSEDLKDEPLEQDRFEHISYLGQCVYKHTNGDFDFHKGQTFWWLPITPIPRIIMPFKPKNIMATTVAEEYQLKGSSHGAMNFPMLVEFYINFDFFGIVVLSFFQGWLLSWIVRVVGFGFGDLNLLILLNILIQFSRVEMNITLVFGAFFQALLFWWVLIKYLNLEKRFFSTHKPLVHS